MSEFDVSVLRKLYEAAHPRTNLTDWNRWVQVATETDALLFLFTTIDEANAEIAEWKALVEQKDRELEAAQADMERAHAKAEEEKADLRELAAQDRTNTQREIDAMSDNLREKEAMIGSLQEQVAAFRAVAEKPAPAPVVEPPAPKRRLATLFGKDK